MRIVPVIICMLLGIAVARGQEDPVAEEEKTFKNVVEHVDMNGNFLLVMNTEQAIDALNRVADNFGVIASLSAPPWKRNETKMGANIIASVYDHSGLRDLDAVAISSKRVDAKSYRTKMYAAMDPARKESLLNVIGKESHELTCMEFLPQDTVIASFCDFDAAFLLNWLKGLAQAQNNPQVSANFDRMVTNLDQKISLRKLIAGTNGQVGVVVTLDRETKVNLPGPNNQKITIPEPALAMFVKVKDDSLQDFIFSRFKAINEKIPFSEKTVQDVTIRTYNLPVNLPIRVTPSFAMFDGYLIAANTPAMIQSIINAKKGKKDRLLDHSVFKKIAKDVPTKGNVVHYFSPRLAEELKVVQQTMVSQMPPEMQHVIKKLQQPEDDEFYSYGVVQILPNGVQLDSISTISGGQAVLAQTAIAPVAILAGMALPVLSKAREKARRVNCSGNLKQLGLACLMYSGENGGDFPPDLATLAEEQVLNAGKVYVCPSADEDEAPLNAADLKAGKTSYLYLGKGLRDDNVQATRTVIACDKPGNHDGRWMNFLFVDGHVEGRSVGSLKEARERYNWIIPNVELVKKKDIPEAKQDKMRKLCRQLGSQDFQKRKEAEEELRKLGMKARPILKEFLDSRDPEIKMTVRKLLDE